MNFRTQVELPKREVTIKQIELVSDIKRDNDKIYFDIKCLVSKGTYIRSLINDLAKILNTFGVMENLRRTKQGNFDINQAVTLEQVEKKDYKLDVNFPEMYLEQIPAEKRAALIQILEQDPRPSYQKDPVRIYGMSYAGMEIHFRVDKETLYVTEVERS